MADIESSAVPEAPSTFEPAPTSIDAAQSAIMELLKRPSGTSEPEEPEPAPTPAPKAAVAAPVAEESAEEDASAPEVEAVEAETEDTTVPEPKAAAPKEPEKPAQDTAKAARDSRLNELNNLVPQLSALLTAQFPDIKTEADLLKIGRESPERYNEYQLAKFALQSAATEQQRLHEGRFQEWQSTERDKLYKLMPDLKDPVKGPRLAEKIAADLRKDGYTNAQIQVADAAMILRAHKAILYDELQSRPSQDAKKIEQAKAKAATAPPVQKPGTTRNASTKEDKLKEDYSRLQKTGRQEDAAAVFRHFVNG